MSTHDNAPEAAATALEQLREVLLRNDRSEIAALRRVLESSEELDKYAAELVERRISERVLFLQKNFAQTFGQPVDTLIENKIEQSKEELLNVIYPVLGRMIKKFIALQFQLLKEQIEAQLRQTRTALSPRHLTLRLRARLFGLSESEQLLSELHRPVVQEVYLIQKGSGLLLGSYSRQNTADQDLIAGMLTAIKAFGEDAFLQDGQDLEVVEWQDYQIFMQNFHTFYIAVAATGQPSAAFREDIRDRLANLIEKEFKHLHIRSVDQAVYDKISARLKGQFKPQ